MDARALYAVLWHPQSLQRGLDGRSITHTKTRTEVGGVRYYFTDFSMAGRWEPVAEPPGFEPERAMVSNDDSDCDPYQKDFYYLGEQYEFELLY
ncbi:hypothetical protein FRB90_007957, partial [Tulasnella sp. 427]